MNTSQYRWPFVLSSSFRTGIEKIRTIKTFRAATAVSLWLILTTLILGITTLAFSQGTEAHLRAFIRISAWVATLLFSIAFATGPITNWFQGPWVIALKAHRRNFGIGFATIMGLHLAALVLLGLRFPDPFLTGLGWVTILGGGAAYGCIAALALTSNGRAVHWLGRRRWQRLHTGCSWYIWIVLVQTYLSGELGESFSSLLAALLIAVALLHMTTSIKLMLRGRILKHAD